MTPGRQPSSKKASASKTEQSDDDRLLSPFQDVDETPKKGYIRQPCIRMFCVLNDFFSVRSSNVTRHAQGKTAFATDFIDEDDVFLEDYSTRYFFSCRLPHCIQLMSLI